MSRPKYISPVFELIAPNEVFLDITPNAVPGIYDLYMVSNYGRIYSKYVGRIMSPGINGGGYYFIAAHTLNGVKNIMVHRVELLTFNYTIGCEYLDVNHKDGDKLNNFLGNLEWLPHRDNMIHSYNNGLHPKEDDSPLSIITSDIAREICQLLDSGMYTNIEIANMLGYLVTPNIVSAIKQKLTWKDVSKDYSFNQRIHRLFSEEEVHNMCKYFENNTKPSTMNVNDYCRSALSCCGIDSSDRYVDSARKIYNKRYHTDISSQYNF